MGDGSGLDSSLVFVTLPLSEVLEMGDAETVRVYCLNDKSVRQVVPTEYEEQFVVRHDDGGGIYLQVVDVPTGAVISQCEGCQYWTDEVFTRAGYGPANCHDLVDKFPVFDIGRATYKLLFLPNHTGALPAECDDLMPGNCSIFQVPRNPHPDGF